MSIDLYAPVNHKPNAPERIYDWQHSQMSVARHYGGLNYMGHDYTIAVHEPQQPLVRADVLAREVQEAKAKRKALKAGKATGGKND